MIKVTELTQQDKKFAPIYRLNIGCGTDIRDGYVNTDIVLLPGVDIAFDNNNFPYPFPDEIFSEILLINVLEHLPDTIGTIEELYRISKNAGELIIRVPYWNSLEMSTDPTHKSFFNEKSFDYFDPSKQLCIRRPYYSNARFKIRSLGVWIYLNGRYILIKHDVVCKMLLGVSHYLSNIVRLIEFTLEPLKPRGSNQTKDLGS